MNDVVQLTTLTYARAASKLEVGFDVVFCVDHVQSLLGVGGGRVPGSIIRVPLSWCVVDFEHSHRIRRGVVQTDMMYNVVQLTILTCGSEYLR